MNEYQTKSNQIRQLAALPPEKLADHLSNLHNALDGIAPEIAPHVYSTAGNAISFLNNKLPFAGNELPQDSLPEPSRAQKEAWLNLHDAISDPIGILDHVNKGTLTSHHLEALHNVYPDLHQEMSQKIVEKLGDLNLKNRKIPYSKRISLTKFLGVPIDSTLTPESMQAIIKSASPNTGPAAQEVQKPKKASGTELGQIQKVTDLYKTPDQARETPKK